MVDFILKYWVQIAFTALLGLFSWLWRKLTVKVKTELAEQSLIKDGVLAILHDRIYQACTGHLAKKWCSLEDRKNLEYMYNSYHNLGGNGTGTDMYNRVCALPIDAPSKKRKDE